MPADETQKDRKKTCRTVATRRARQARQKGLNPLLVAMVFISTFLTSMFSTLQALPLLVRSNGRRQRHIDHSENYDWPVSDYERGCSGTPIIHSASSNIRYRSQPSMIRLMADLRRPAARKDAGAALALRIADTDVRSWVADRIAKDELNRVSIYVRPGFSDETILAGWRSELNAESDDEALRDNQSGDRTDQNNLRQFAKFIECFMAKDSSGGSKGPRQA